MAAQQPVELFAQYRQTLFASIPEGIKDKGYTLTDTYTVSEQEIYKLFHKKITGSAHCVILVSNHKTPAIYKLYYVFDGAHPTGEAAKRSLTKRWPDFQDKSTLVTHKAYVNIDPSSEDKLITSKDIPGDILVSIFASFVLGVILHFIVLPIFYHLTSYSIDDSYPMTWTTYFIIVFVSFLIICPLALCSQPSQTTPQPPRPRRKRHTYYNSHLETDYYDSDMEGAPGYYGGDE